MLEILMEIMRTTIEMYQKYFTSGMLDILFLLAIVFLILYQKEKQITKMFLGEMVLFLILYFCPISAYIIMKYCIGEIVYVRMFWLLPISFILAYVMTQSLDFAQEKWKKMLVAAILICVVIFSGTVMYTETFFQKSSNAYKIPQEVIDICDEVEKDAAKNGITEKKMAVQNQFLCYVRQYDADIVMPYGRNGIRGESLSGKAEEIYYTINSAEIDWEKLGRLLQEADCNYFVYWKNDDIAKSMAETQYYVVADVDGYYIYRYDETGKIE